MISISKVTSADAIDIFEMASQLSMSFEVRGKHDVEDFERALNDDTAIFLIARFGDSVAGYLYGNTHYAFYAARNVGLVEEIFVKESFRKMGIATELLKHAEHISQERNAALISVATRRAEPFYEKCGYDRSAQYFRKFL